MSQLRKSAKDLFLAALDIEPADRPAFLDEACAGDAALRRQADALLRVHDEPDSLLDGPRIHLGLSGDGGIPSPDPTIDSPITEKPGTVIGPYKLLQKIGEGGFGVVYMADQTEPVKRRVALKIIKPGMDTQQIIARFETERQALAMMDHPNIAKVLDAGTTDSGRPYFVMELVKGVPITQFCDERQLTPRERLELFVPVCQALQHAHQKGIIHRDIKPSNVMVAKYDDRPVPKVIDFGVVKAIEQHLTEKTMFTQFGQVVGTVEYMSPEQADLNQLDIDTRSDIYSLGVLLYELLTGNTPFDRQRLRSAAFDELLRIIREEEPPMPSLRLSNSQSLRSIAANRHTEPKKLSTLVHGELDWIVMKALEKDRTRRYETANGFANDIQRYLNDEAVVACPPSAGYRFRKFARRNKAAIVTASLIACALLLGLAGTSWQAVRATHARREEAAQRITAVAAREEAERERQAAVVAKDQAEVLRQKAEQLSAENRNRLVRQYVARGTSLVEDKDFLASLPWFVEALRLDADDPAKEHIHRTRLATILQQCPKPAQILFHDPGEPRSRYAEFSSDGLRVLTLAGTARIWDAMTGSSAGETIPGEDWNCARLSPDGRRLVTGSLSGVARVWDATTGKPISPPMNHPTGSVFFAGFSPDGTRVVTTPDYAGKWARVWDATSGEPITPPLPHKGGWGLDASFSSDGNLLATVDQFGEGVQIWELPSGRLVKRISASGIQFSPDGERLVATAGSEARVWDPRAGQAITPVLAHKWSIAHCEFSANGQFVVTASLDQTARVWDARSGEPITPPLRHTRAVHHASFSPDGLYVVTASDDRTARVWEVATGEVALPPLWHVGPVRSARFSPDGRRIVTKMADTTARIWELASCVPSLHRLEHASGVNDVAFSPDGHRVVTGSRDGTARVWDAETGLPLTPPLKHSAGVVHVAFGPEGQRIVATCENGTARVWDAASGSPVTDSLNLSIPQSDHGPDQDYAAFNRDGRLLLTLSGNHGLNKGAVRVWNAATGEPVTTALIQNLPVNHAAFSPDGGQIVTGAGHRHITRFGPTEGTLTTWSLPAGQPIVQFSAPLPVRCVGYSHDGELLLSAHAAGGADRGYARIWDAHTGKPMTPEMYHDGAVQSACFSPDQRQVATASDDNTARIWDASSGEPITAALEHRDGVTSVAFSPDGTLLATASKDNTARVWDVVNGEPVTPALRHHGAVNQVAFSPNGHYIVTASADGAARIWPIPSDHRLLEDVDSLQLVLSGRQLDGSGKLSEFETTSLPAAWESFQANHGDAFRVDERQQTLWRDETLSGLLARGSELALSYAIRSAPNLPKCHAARGHLFSKMKEWEKAIADYSRAIELEPDEVVYRNNRANAYCQAGQWANAANDFSQSISIAPDREIVHYRHTLACLGAGDQKAYRDACARMIQQFAGNETVSAGHWLAWSCVLAPDAVSNFPEVVKAAGRAVSEELDSDQHFNTLGAILYRAGRYEESVEWMNEIAEQDSVASIYSPAYTWFFLAMAHHQLGHEEEGRTWLKKAIDHAEEETQDDANVAWNRRLTLDLFRTEAESLLASPDVDTQPSDEKGPLPSADMSLSLSDRYRWVLHYRRAMRFADGGNWTEAEKAFWQATKLRPDKADLLIRRAADQLIGAAKVDVRLERWDHALELFDKVIKLRPNVAADATIYAQMLVLANRTKEYQEACATMLHQFGQSEDPDALCTAAQTCLLSPNGVGDLTVPLELAKRAVAMQRESGWMHHVLGMAHFRVGQYEEAANQFHDSLELYSGWSVLHLNWLGLAMVHHELGETDKARQWYDMAVDRMTTDPAACRRRFEDWLEGQIRRREAEQLLGIRQAGQEAPQPAAREPKPAEPEVEVETADPEGPDNAP